MEIKQRLDEYFSDCLQLMVNDNDKQYIYKEIILPNALTEDSIISLNEDNKYFADIFEDEDDIYWINRYTSEDITEAEFLLYNFRFCISFECIEDEWINERDENLKRILKKIKIHEIKLHNKETVKEQYNYIIENNLLGRYDPVQIEEVKKFIGE